MLFKFSGFYLKAISNMVLKIATFIGIYLIFIVFFSLVFRMLFYGLSTNYESYYSAFMYAFTNPLGNWSLLNTDSKQNYYNKVLIYL